MIDAVLNDLFGADDYLRSYMCRPLFPYDTFSIRLLQQVAGDAGAGSRTEPTSKALQGLDHGIKPIHKIAVDRLLNDGVSPLDTYVRTGLQYWDRTPEGRKNLPKLTQVCNFVSTTPVPSPTIMFVCNTSTNFAVFWQQTWQFSCSKLGGFAAANLAVLLRQSLLQQPFLQQTL